MAVQSGLFITLSALLGGIAVAVIVPPLIDALVRMQRVIRIRGTLADREKHTIWELALGDLCTNGIFLARIPARGSMRIPFFKRSTEAVQKAYELKIAGCNSRAVSESLLTLCVICGGVAFVLTAQLFVAVLCCVTPPFIVRFKAEQWIREQRNALRAQLPDALRGLGMCFMAGLSLEQAFDQTAEESQDPLRRELQKTVDDLQTGSSIMDSLSQLDKRLAMDEMRFVSVALEIQHRTGGSMREVLDAAADSMLASFDLSRSLEVQTAQARLSARIVSILPLVLVALLSLAMEGYLASFFTSLTGFALLLCALVMELAGILIIRRILGVDLR